MSGVEDENLDSTKKVQIWWMGVKYTYAKKPTSLCPGIISSRTTSVVPSICSATAGFRSSCAGDLDEVSLYVDHRFTKRFDAFAGIAYSDVSGGPAIAIPHGPGVPYNHDSNLAPVIGGRFAF